MMDALVMKKGAVYQVNHDRVRNLLRYVSAEPLPNRHLYKLSKRGMLTSVKEYLAGGDVLKFEPVDVHTLTTERDGFVYVLANDRLALPIFEVEFK